VVDSTPLADNAQIELMDTGKLILSFILPSLLPIAYLASNRKMRRKMGLTGYMKVKKEWRLEKS